MDHASHQWLTADSAGPSLQSQGCCFQKTAGIIITNCSFPWRLKKLYFFIMKIVHGHLRFKKCIKAYIDKGKSCRPTQWRLWGLFLSPKAFSSLFSFFLSFLNLKLSPWFFDYGIFWAFAKWDASVTGPMHPSHRRLQELWVTGSLGSWWSDLPAPPPVLLEANLRDVFDSSVDASLHPIALKRPL